MNEKTATRRRKYVSQRVLAASFNYVICFFLIDKKLREAVNEPARISHSEAFVIRGLWDSLSDKRRTFIVRDEAFRNIAHLIGEAE